MPRIRVRVPVELEVSEETADVVSTVVDALPLLRDIAADPRTRAVVSAVSRVRRKAKRRRRPTLG